MENDRGPVERVVRLITYFASSQGDVSVKEVADALDLPQSTTHRLIQQLIALGLVQRAQGARRYAFGPEMYRLGAMITNRLNVVHLAMEPLRRIVAYSNECCALALYRDEDATLVFAERVASTQQLRYQLDLYQPVSVIWGASGHAVMAHLPAQRVAALLEKEPVSPTGLRSLPSDELQAELELIRKRGYAASTRAEKIDGAAGVSAPIFGANGQVIGCFSLFIPRMRYPQDKETQLGELLAREAKNLSDVLAGKS